MLFLCIILNNIILFKEIEFLVPYFDLYLIVFCCIIDLVTIILVPKYISDITVK